MRVGIAHRPADRRVDGPVARLRARRATTASYRRSTSWAAERGDERRRTPPACARPRAARSSPGRAGARCRDAPGRRRRRGRSAASRPFTSVPCGGPTPGCTTSAGGLVDHHDVVVLVDHGHRHRGVGLRERRRGGRAASTRAWLPASRRALRATDLPVDGHRAASTSARTSLPRPAGEQRQRAVDALARERLGHHDRRHDVARRRSRRRLMRLGVVGSGSGSGLRKLSRINRIAPTVIAESATLNDGNEPTLTKSTTWPREHTRRAEDPVAEVAERAAEHERQRDDRPPVGGPAQRAHEPDREPDREHREDDRRVGERGERATGVAGDAELDVVADDRQRRVGVVSRRPTTSSAGRASTTAPTMSGASAAGAGAGGASGAVRHAACTRRRSRPTGSPRGAPPRCAGPPACTARRCPPSSARARRRSPRPPGSRWPTA